MHRSQKYLQSFKPSSPEEMLEFNNSKSLTWGKANLINFWIIRVVVVETETTNNKGVGRIKSDMYKN